MDDTNDENFYYEMLLLSYIWQEICAIYEMLLLHVSYIWQEICTIYEILLLSYIWQEICAMLAFSES